MAWQRGMSGLICKRLWIVARSRAVAGRLRAGVEHLLRKNAVPMFHGRGRLSGCGRVSVARDGEVVAELSAPGIILATGAART